MRSGWIDRTVIAGFVMALAGLVFLVVGVVVSVGTISFLKEAETAEGTVTEIEERRELRGRRVRTVSYASIDFVGADGKLVKIQFAAGWLVPGGAVGDKVDLLYLEGAPEDARVDSFVGTWENTLIGLGGALLLLGGSAIAIMPAWRRRTRR